MEYLSTWGILVMVLVKIIIGLLVGTFSLSVGAASPSPEAKLGLIDLQSWSGEDALALEGEWLFFPNELLDPSTLYTRLAEGRYQTTTIDREFSFAKLLGDGHENNLGFGTYALVMSHIPTAVDLSITPPAATTASEMFWVARDHPEQSRSLVRVGQPGTSKQESMPGVVVPRAIALKSISSEAALVIHVSNFHLTWWGGLWAPPHLGSSDFLVKQKDKASSLHYLSIGILLFIAFTNLSLFWQRREDRGSLWLSVLSLIFALRTFTYMGGSFWFVSDTAKFSENLKILCSSFCLLPLAGILFFSVYFPRQFGPRLLKIAMILSLPPTIFIWLMPPLVFGHLINTLLFLVGCGAVLILFLLIRVFIAGEVGGTICVLGMLGPLAGATLELLGAFGITRVPMNAMGYGMVVFLVFQSQIVAARFVQAFRKSEHLSRHLQIEVDRQTRDIRSILDNIKQGIFTIFNPGKLIGSQYAPYTLAMMDCQQLDGRSLDDVLLKSSQLSSEQKSQLNSALDSCLGEDPINFEMNEACLPQEIIINKTATGEPQVLEVQWSPIVDADNRVEKILVCARDVTELRQLRFDAENSRRELVILQEIIKVPEDKFARFLNKTNEYLAENAQYLKASPEGSPQIAKRLFVNLHTMKGTARTFQFKTLSNRTHEAEQYLADHLKGKEAWDLSRQLEELQAVRSCLLDYQNIAREKLHWNLGKQAIKMTREDIVSLLPILQNLEGEIQSYDGKSQLAILGTRLLENCFNKLNDIISEAARGLDSIAKDCDKNLPDIIIGPNKYLLIDDWNDRIHSVLTHVLRNAIDHGIEAKGQRIAAGKRPVGNIFIRLSDDGTYLDIEIQDDGNGLDLDKIKRIGMERNLLSQASPTDIDIAMLIFHSGFTTKDQVTDISGRGVGMDAVKSFIEDGGGSVHLELEADPLDRQHIAFALHLCLPRKAWVEAPSAEKFDIDQQLRAI